MTLYAKVKNGSVEYTRSLPKSYQNVSGFNKLSNAKLKTYGFLPLTLNVPQYNHLTEKLDGISYTINANDVVGEYNVVALNQQELDNKKNSLFKSCRALLIELLYHTDWVDINGSSLQELVKESYDDLRGDIKAVKGNLTELSLEDLHELNEKATNAKDCLCSRLDEFSEKMDELEACLKGLLSE